jgi:predicted DNA-binding transcriptional regulator AlpA
MSKTTHIDASERLAVPAADVAKLLGISQRHLWALHSSGRLGPLPIRFGRAVRWNLAELQAWIDADAPERSKWLAQRQGGGR